MPLQDHLLDAIDAYPEKNSNMVQSNRSNECLIRNIQVSRTIGTIGQIKLLSEFATNIFSKVADEMNIITERLSKIKNKVIVLQSSNLSETVSLGTDNADELTGQYEILQGNEIFL